MSPIPDVVEQLRRAGAVAGSPVGLAVAPGIGVGLAVGAVPIMVGTDADPAALISQIEATLSPRWIWWTQTTAATLVAHGVRVSRCWDVSAVHRLLDGGWRADPARVWAWLHDRPSSSIPVMGQLDLLATADDGDGSGAPSSDAFDPAGTDGHLRPEWVAGEWARSPEHLARWAGAAVSAHRQQRTRLDTSRREHGARWLVAHAESSAELLCAELAHDGLPVDRDAARDLLANSIGLRPADEREAAELRATRDAAVLRHAPMGGNRDLRNPAHVRDLLRRVGVDVTDTRAWRLEALRDVHPFVPALLTWRKSERIATTYGYGWLDRHVGVDGRLRGDWSGSDGAAGRMTAGAGLHNLPADMRGVVVADPGHVFVRADLGQIEPRVLAAVSGDDALAQAASADDLYAPVARRLGVERSVAKVAVLAAMYGQRSGNAGVALHNMMRAYPTAMAYLDAADEDGRNGRDVVTYGGRRVRMSADVLGNGAAMSAQGRYARNAVVQGAAAELFKVWAATVRARLVGTGASIVLCLHDELLVHAPVDRADHVAIILVTALDEAVHRWQPPGVDVRFLADVSAVRSWSDAKP